METLSLPPPITAQTLFTSAIAHRSSDGFVDSQRKKLRLVSASENEVDDYVLLGGLDHGCVVGMSAGTSGVNGIEEDIGRIVPVSLIVTSVLSRPNVKVMVVDSTGSFPVMALHRTLKERIVKQNERERMRRGGDDKAGYDGDVGDVGAAVEDCLQRVGISRVFNVEGLWEVLREVTEGGQGLGDDERLNDEETELAEKASMIQKSDSHEMGKEAVLPRTSRPFKVPQSTEQKTFEIQDSDAEDSDLELGSSPPRLEAQVNPDKANSKPNQENTSIMELFIVDNMTTLINELFSRAERIAAHQTLAALSRTLSTVASTQKLAILLMNTLITSRASKADPASETPSRPPSVFTSTVSRPGLGHVFSDLVQLHLMITNVPRTRLDVDAFNSFDENDDEETHSTKSKRQHRVKYSHIIEVLKDTCTFLPSCSGQEIETPAAQWLHLQQQKQAGRLQRREQRWCALDTLYDDAGNAVGVHNTFDTGKSMRAMGQMRPGKIGPGGRILSIATDVGGVAKVFGFGGRRV